MSAFMVSDEHISAILAVIAHGPSDAEQSNGPRWQDRMVWANIVPKDELLDSKTLTPIGLVLVSTNADSLAERYPNHPREDTTYKYVRPLRIPTIAEAFKLIECYEYQSCEHDGWDISVAKRICLSLRSHLAQVLPGWSYAEWAL